MTAPNHFQVLLGMAHGWNDKNYRSFKKSSVTASCVAYWRCFYCRSYIVTIMKNENSWQLLICIVHLSNAVLQVLWLYQLAQRKFERYSFLPSPTHPYSQNQLKYSPSCPWALKQNVGLKGTGANEKYQR